MHLVLSRPLLDSSIAVATKWRVESKLKLQVFWSKKDETEIKDVSFISENICLIDGKRFLMKPEPFRDLKNYNGPSQDLLTVWLMN